MSDLVSSSDIALMMMLRWCCRHRPTCALHFESRSSCDIASHAASPIFSLPASSATATRMRLVFSAVEHVSPWITVFSDRRCMPRASGSGAPAAAQLPTPNRFSWTAFHSSSSRRPCEKIFESTDLARASAVPPAVSVHPRCTTSTLVPGASCGSI